MAEKNLQQDLSTNDVNDNAGASNEEASEVVAEGSTYKGKKILLLLVPMIIGIISATIYILFSLYSSSGTSTNDEHKATTEKGGPEYYFIDMNNMIVTISSSADMKKNYLKLSLSMQVKTQDAETVINQKLPIINDSFQTFLKELRRADLSGSAGVIMLKAQLLKRVNAIIAPQEVLDILFKEIILS